MSHVNFESFSIQDIVVPSFDVQLGSIMYLGFPIDIDLERVKHSLLTNLEAGKKTACVSVVNNTAHSMMATDILQFCQYIGLSLNTTNEILHLIGVSADQHPGRLGFSELKILHTAVALESEQHVLVYDTCGTDCKWARKIDQYVNSKMMRNQQCAIKLVYPVVFKHRVEFEIPANVQFITPCSEERILRSSEGVHVEDLLNIISSFETP